MYFCCRSLPLAPGDAVAGLAVVAVIMTVRADRFSLVEKVIWVPIAFSLLWTESRTIHQDRAEHDAHQLGQEQSQQQGFELTLARFRTVLKQSQDHFDTTMERADRILTQSSEAAQDTRITAEQVTGFDRYVYLDFHVPQSPAKPVTANLTKVGDYPIYRLHISVDKYSLRTISPSDVAFLGNSRSRTMVGYKYLIDIPGASNPTPEHIYDLGEELSKLDRKTPVFATGTDVVLIATFEAKNGSWIEHAWLHLVKGDEAKSIPDRWIEAIAAYKETYTSSGETKEGDMILNRIDADFSAIEAKKFLNW